MSRIIYGLAFAILATTACGSPVADLSMTEVAAHWECDRQRFAFDDLADIDLARNEMLEEAGISAETYEAFESDLATNIDLRQEVLVEYEDYCEVADDDGAPVEN